MPSHSAYSVHKRYDHFVSAKKQIPILTGKKSGAAVLHACDRTFGGLVMTWKLWSPMFACFCVSNIDLGTACKALFGTYNHPSINGIRQAIEVYQNSLLQSEDLSSIVRDKSMDLKKMGLLLKQAGHPMGCLKKIKFLVLIPLMNQHPEFESWKENGYVNHPSPSFGFDYGGFCLPIRKSLKKNRRHYEYLHSSTSETEEGEG